MVMYFRQQNKCYLPNERYSPISKLHSTVAVVNLLEHNNISQICYCGQERIEPKNLKQKVFLQSFNTRN